METKLTASGAWLQQHRWVTDSLVSILVLGYEAMYIALVSYQRGLGPGAIAAFIAAVAMCAVFPLRRRWPLVTFGIVSVAAWGLLLLGLGLSPGSMTMSALLLFTLATRFGWTVVASALAAVCVWAVVGGLAFIEAGMMRIGEVGVIVLAAVCVAMFGVAARHRRGRLEALRERADQLARERDAQAAISAAEERARIAREIHDIVSHSLGTMVVMADGAARTAESAPQEASRAMARVRDTGREAMAEMRRMLDVLRDDEAALRAPQPGLDSLERLLEENRATGMRVDLTVTGSPVELPTGVDLAAYRIVQEALTNARKHGGPLLSLVMVAITYRDAVIDLRIADDGAGVNAEAPASRSGHGLVGMRERVTAYGGWLKTGPRPQRGFEVHAVLPIGGTT
ncbi:hypothetical protein HMPREF3162_05140 [Brevibacterium sp. HMSC07C04]|nr:hypothetical protein HMPREF3162_05140 [Brevibacterium sp. HMSC07C04]